MHQAPPWWDRETDELSGQILRLDVRESARRIWGTACSRAWQFLGDTTDAPELWELSVKAISRYLDKQGVLPFSREIDGLLFLAFDRSVRRLARKRKRIQLLGGANDITELFIAPDWLEETDRRLFLEQLAGSLDAQSRTVLRLRIAGYNWKEIGRILKTAPALARKSFWRGIRKAQLQSTQIRRDKSNS
jgi:hypothetical protein